MPRDTTKLKELVFNILNDDITLQTLLGDDNEVRHDNPLQLSEYPCVVYSILIEKDDPYDTDISCDITSTNIITEVFSTDTSSKESDAIDDRIYALLHGKNLSNSDFVVYTSNRKSRTPIYEPEVKVRRIVSRYDLVNVLK